MAASDNILKITNSKGRDVYYLGYNSNHTMNVAGLLQSLFALEDFGDESAEEILEEAGADGMEFAPCTNPEDIKPEEVTLFIDFSKKTASLPPMDAQPIKEFEEDWDVKIAEIEGEMHIYWDEDDPQPLQPWPEEFKDLLDKEEAPIERVSALVDFLIEEDASSVDFICDGRVIHCEEA